MTETATSDVAERFLTLHEFIPAARKKLTDDKWDYMVGGAETETTLKRNRMALDSLGFRPRVLRDVSNIDCSASLFGKKLRMPVMLAPVGSIQRFDPGGSAAVRSCGWRVRCAADCQHRYPSRASKQPQRLRRE
jgi:glycolate oxidase